MLLIALLLIPLVGALLVAAGSAKTARAIAASATLAALALSVWVACVWRTDGAQTQSLFFAVPWAEGLGVMLAAGLDGVSLLLVLLTALLGPICVFASFSAIRERERTYYASLLALQAAVTGVFIAKDLILFYTCFEFTLVPMFVLISIYGSTNRKKAAVKFFLYTFTGSIIALAGLVYIAWRHAERNEGQWTFMIDALAVTARSLPIETQGWLLLAMMAGFAVKVPLFPVHTWLPLAHTEAPTAGSVVLAGVLLKLGTYAVYRFVLPFTPAAVAEYAPLLANLCVIGIVYGGLICWVQTDVKKLVAYSSVAHLGFCMLGMFALNHTGVAGSILYMINHGLSTGALFLLIGMVYERYHTRSMKELGGLGARMPVWSTFMVFFTMASVGLPGLNGFVSEFMCLMGTFQASSAWGSGVWGSLAAHRPVGATFGDLGPWYAIIAGTGVIIAAMYLLYMLGHVVWGKLREPHAHDHGAHNAGETNAVLPADLTAREIGVLAPLAALCIFLGVYPGLVLDMISPDVRNTLTMVEVGRAAADVSRAPHEPAEANAEHASPQPEVHR